MIEMDKNTETTKTAREFKLDRTRIHVAYEAPAGKTVDSCLILAHGVRSYMKSSIITYLHTALAHKGFLTVKFNFPFAEGRFRPVRRPDPKDTLVKCYRQVIEETRHSEWAPKDFFLGGVSLGAAVASHVIADRPEVPGVKGLFFLAYPLHLPRNPSALGDSHLEEITLPMLFVSGNRDVYAEEDALKKIVSRLGPKAQLQMIDADHGFNRRRGKTVYSKTLGKVADVVSKWASSLST